MKDFNLFTGILSVLGACGILYGFIHIGSIHWLSFGILTVLVLIMELFPIRLPNGILYSAGTVGLMYLVLVYGFSACELALLIGTTVSFIKVTKATRREMRWIRFMATLGMYTVAAGAAVVFAQASVHLPLAVRVFAVLVLYEGTNFFLLAGVQRSLGKPGPRIRVYAQSAAIPTCLFTVLLTRLLIIQDTTLLVTEIVFCLFFLFVIYAFSVQYKQMADRYQESEEKYRLIAENTLDVIVVLDANLRITYTSPSHQTVFGWGGSFVGDTLLQAIHEDDRHILEECFQALRDDLKAFQTQFRYRNHGREWITVEGTGSPVVGQCGELDRVVMVIRDITERTEAEELLRKSDKLAVVGQLAAGVAHELRNPLTAMKGFLQLLKTRVETGMDYINIMLAEINRIELIIGEFLILAKPHAVQFQSKNPHELLQSVIALLQTQAVMNNVEIVTNTDCEVPNTRCEANQLKQLFINILKNAIESMPNGGRIYIDLKYEAGQGIVVRFKDEGIGIPEECLVHIGEPFYTTKQSGTGLGLMISYQIVQAHNGKMDIVSAVNEGTTVRITLPNVS